MSRKSSTFANTVKHGYEATVAGAAAAATATGAAVAAGIAGTAIAGTAIGTACIVAAPLAVAVGVGCAISSIWNAIWD